MLKSTYLTEHDLKDFGFRSIGTNVRISSDARIYGQEKISIGSNVRIDDFAILSAGNGYIAIGNYAMIARNCHLSGGFGIEMKDFTCLAANTIIYSATDDYSGDFMTNQSVPKEYVKLLGGPVIIGRHVVMGCSSVVIGGCTIGEGCSLGSMTLVNKDLDPWGIYIGIPARRIKERSKHLLTLEKQFLDSFNF